MKASEAKRQEVEDLLRAGKTLVETSRITGVHYNSVKGIWRKLFPEAEGDLDKKYLEHKGDTASDWCREWDRVRLQLLNGTRGSKKKKKKPQDSNGGGRRFT